MRWITRERVRVGRIGCAWLITRFIDPAAELYFVPGPQLASEAARLGATIFHEHGSELARRGDISSFEVVLERYGLASDPALALLGQIVNTADIKTSPYRRPEGAGLKAITDGLLLLHADDHAVCEAGFRVYEALYAYCRSTLKEKH
ncbi:MAG TPA: chromate resistance protein ChrB domain-containing protein [Roseiflexaceae bacterium]|nr:chromate resistance protein ChrB domain-containing protein [Roseiflexaceae bacterium]